MKKWWKNKREEKMKCNHAHAGGLGCLWIAGWLFTVGLLKLAFWKAVLALVVWAYYLGVAAAHAWGI